MADVFRAGKRRIDRTDFLWLAYLIFFVIEPVQRRSAAYWVECLCILGVFLFMYVRFLRAESVTEKVLFIAGMTLLGAVTTPFNEGGIAFLIYSCALAPYALADTSLVFGVAILNVSVIAVESTSLHFSMIARFINIFFAVLAAFANVVFAQKDRNDCKLRMKQEEIEALAAVAERERIARDLHDVLGHTLSVIVLKTELAGRLVERECAALTAADPDSSKNNILRARAELADVERTARTALAEVREAIGGYRARGLGAEIEAARNTLLTAGIALRTEGDLQLPALTPGEETVLALALREAITNIVRHAKATECRLSLLLDRGHHRLSIQDNGQHAAAHEGNGLRGMRERVEGLGGQLSVSREAGTHLFIDIPQRTFELP